MAPRKLRGKRSRVGTTSSLQPLHVTRLGTVLGNSKEGFFVLQADGSGLFSLRPVWPWACPQTTCGILGGVTADRRRPRTWLVWARWAPQRELRALRWTQMDTERANARGRWRQAQLLMGAHVTATRAELCALSVSVSVSVCLCPARRPKEMPCGCIRHANRCQLQVTRLLPARRAANTL